MDVLHFSHQITDEAPDNQIKFNNSEHINNVDKSRETSTNRCHLPVGKAGPTSYMAGQI
jgi:hypothetical protein